jgi:hypothetical protein
MQGIKIDESLIKSVENDLQKGERARVVANKYGISYASVNNIRIKRGLPTQIYRLEPVLIEKIKRLFEEEHSLREIANSLNMSRNTVSKALKLAGISSLVIKEAATKRQTTVKRNPFADVLCLKTQYYLGLLATDGCIHEESGSISLGLKDKQLVESFSEFVGYPNIYEYKDRRYSDCTMYSIKFVNWEATKQLRDLGLTRRKTFTLSVSFPISFPFLRGVIDGDGHVKKVGKSIEVFVTTASKSFADQLVTFFESQSIKTTLIKTGNVYLLRVSSKNTLELRLRLYEDGGPHLKRKKDVFFQA